MMKIKGFFFSLKKILLVGTTFPDKYLCVTYDKTPLDKTYHIISIHIILINSTKSL